MPLFKWSQTGRGRRRASSPDAVDAYDASLASEASDDGDVDNFFTVVGVWERGGSRSRSTLTETIEVRFHNWEQARHPERLLARCIARLMNRVLRGRAEPLRVGLSVQPPGWDNCFHVPMRPPRQNSAHALAAAIEAFAKQYDELDLLTQWSATRQTRGGCASSTTRRRGGRRWNSLSTSCCTTGP